MTINKLHLYKTENWTKEHSDCIFLHFDDFEEPPETLCSNPMISDFEVDYWTHYIQIDLNFIFDQFKNEYDKLKHENDKLKKDLKDWGEECFL